MMPVDINQWRATIGCFRVSIQNLSPLRKTVKPFSTLFQICNLYWFCCCFTAISVLVLPLTLMMEFLAVHFVAKNTPFLPLFARVHRSAKTVIYMTIELIKRIPLGIAGLFQYKYWAYFLIQKSVGWTFDTLELPPAQTIMRLAA